MKSMRTEIDGFPTASRRTALLAGLAVLGTSALPAGSLLPAAELDATAKTKQTLTVVVMDPLAAPLACDCVKGYANRQYQRLTEWLEAALDCKLNLVFAESLVELKAKDDSQSYDIVIGKHSVVLHHARAIGQQLSPIASLVGNDGKTTQRGLFTVRSDSAAASLLDLDNAMFLFGNEDCDEKWSAPKKLIEQLEIEVAPESKSVASCSEAAKELLKLPADTVACAVISSYAAPLLEGCGTINKGDLRVIGQSEDVPFIVAFVNQELPSELRAKVANAICQSMPADLQASMETKKGFQPYVGS